MISTTNKMQRNTIFIAVKTVHVSGEFPAHHQELKNCIYSNQHLLSLVAATASVVEMEHGDEISQPRYQWQQLSLTNNRCCMYSF
jgi:hypothetical protein